MAKPRTRLADLAELHRALREEAERRAADAARDRAERERAAREANVFREAVGDSTPLRGTGRVDPRPLPAPPIARQFERDERQALSESISDEIDVERLLETDERLSFRQPGIGQDVVRRLRRGHWVIQEQLDLHGLRVDEARDALVAFLADCLRRGVRCVRIVHGKGLGSYQREPILKGKVLRWLTQRDEVLAFCQAGPSDGGSGALLALLRAPAVPGQPRSARG